MLSEGKFLGLVVLVVVGLVVGIFVVLSMTLGVSIPERPIAPRHEGEVVNAVCLENYDSAVAIKMADGERGFDVYLRDCALLSAHVGDIVSFEVSPGWTHAFNFVIVEDRP